MVAHIDVTKLSLSKADKLPHPPLTTSDTSRVSAPHSPGDHRPSAWTPSARLLRLRPPAGERALGDARRSLLRWAVVARTGYYQYQGQATGGGNLSPAT